MNYLLKFDTEQDAQAALPTLYSIEGWDMSLCIPNVQVWKVTGTQTVTDDGGLTHQEDVREFQSGWFIRVSTDTGLTPFDATGFISSPIFAE